ncbi:MAG: MBL fold metallo-hydrolase [Longimicrobiales bacterium]
MMRTRRGLWLAATLMSGCSAADRSNTDILNGVRQKLGELPTTIGVHATGTINHAAELQGSRPGASDEDRLEETLGWDGAGRFVHEVALDRPDGTEDWVREVYDTGTKTIHLMADSFSVRLREHPEVGGQERLRRRFPRHLLEEAFSADSLVRVAGAAGSDTIVIRARLDESASLDLHISPDSLLRRVTYTGDFPARGATPVSWEFSDYQTSDIGLFPHRYGIEIDGHAFTEMTVQWVSTDDDRVSGLTNPPEGFGDPIEVSGSEGPDGGATVVALGQGLYRVNSLRTGFHPAFIEFADFVAIVDSPAGYPLMLELPAGDVAPGPTPDWLGRRFRELIREAVGDKPVRHVVLTHFHNDHAGGVTAFLEPQTTVYAPAGDTTAIRAFLAGAGYDGVQLAGVDQAVRITDDEQTLDVIPLGPNPHTNEMLGAFLHDGSTLLVHDLIPGVSAEQLMGSDLPPAQAFFREWLARSALAPERLLTIHSSEPVDLRPLSRP